MENDPCGARSTPSDNRYRSLKSVGRRFLRRGKYILGYHPVTLPLYLRIAPILLGISDTSKVGLASRITPSTGLVVEGFPRSGNTFCAEAFRVVSDGRYEIVSHVHHVAQVKSAVKLGIPTIVVIREPVACLASYLVGGPHATVRGVLREYIAYHAGLRRQIPQCMVVDFSDLISDVEAVIARANQAFSLGLQPLEAFCSVDDIFDAIDSDHFRRYLHSNEGLLPRPSGNRSNSNGEYREQLREKRNQVLLEKAKEIYRETVQLGLTV